MKRILLVSGTLFLILGAWVGLRALEVEEHGDIRRATEIAVLASGEIVVGTAGDEEVQLYSSDGEYLGAVSVDSSHGGIRLRALPDGGFQVATVRNRRLYTFDSDARLESVRESFDDHASFDKQGQARATDGTVYQVGGGRIVRRQGARSEVVVDQSGRWPLASDPLLAVLLLASGIAQLVIAGFGAERFRALLIRGARASQPRWVETEASDGGHRPGGGSK